MYIVNIVLISTVSFFLPSIVLVFVILKWIRMGEVEERMFSGKKAKCAKSGKSERQNNTTS